VKFGVKKANLATLVTMQWRSQLKNLGGAKIFDFRRITILFGKMRLMA